MRAQVVTRVSLQQTLMEIKEGLAHKKAVCALKESINLIVVAECPQMLPARVVLGHGTRGGWGFDSEGVEGLLYKINGIASTYLMNHYRSYLEAGTRSDYTYPVYDLRDKEELNELCNN